MDGNATLTRRQFIVTAATAAGGVAVALGTGPSAFAAAAAAQPWSNAEGYDPHDIDAFIAIEPDDSVLIRYVRSEMGQGSMTALPMIVTEELQCDWSKVRVEYASANRSVRENKVYGDMSSYGSHSVKLSREKMQQVGASARERLITAAAARWGVQPQDCTAAKSVVTHTATGRTFRYGELAGDAAKITLAKEPAIKTPDQYTFIGKPMPRIDVPPKTNGSAKFAIDTRLPDMVFAAVNACPVPGGKLKSVDDSPLAAVPGVVQMVRLPDAVAVVATGSFWRAKQALGKLHPEWDVGEAGTTDSGQFSREYHAALDGPAEVARNNGNVDEAFPKAAKTLEAVYETPYLAHAPMEPMNATVHFQPDRLDVWIGTQAADQTIKRAAGVSGLQPEQIYIHNCFIGGGFGRKSANDEMVQAIAIAKAVQRPVKLIWTREEDMRRDRFRPQAVTRFKAGLDANGMPVAWSMRTVVGSILASLGMHIPGLKGPEPMAVAGLANNAYNVPNTRVDAVLKNTHLPVMFWRAPGENQNIFALESFVDEIAAASGQDPYKFRRNLLEGKPDWVKVLDTVAEKSDWGKPLPEGKGRGIAICDNMGSLCAHVAEITVSSKGDLRVDRVTVAVDPHYVVNPLTVAEQMEGGTIFGLSAALYGKITVKNGVPEQGNFDSYRMVRFAQAPKIDVHIVPGGGPAWGGVGEASTPPIMAAVANAIFAVTGKRIRSLPIIDHDLSSGAA